MTVTGRVHGNANINIQPQSTLTFMSDVTAAGQIIHNKHTNDPSSRTAGRIVYKGEHDSGALRPAQPERRAGQRSQGPRERQAGSLAR
jgi:hypothetical protein